ncbi:glycosyltransferase family 4 protein [Litorisediminicola beolgyonensis]|uniref:Glycosyltransferase family 4 protein n=1 Tax=Litorisediminicola beolgyonensis TaxID=1173614 RepID=A0ABW3ZLJ2_9RHOB
MVHPKPFARFVTRKWPPAVGGMERYSQRLAERLPRFCHLDLVALPGRADGTTPSKIELAFFGIRTFLSFLFVRKSSDILHVGDMASWPLALPYALWNRNGVIVVSAHGTDISYALRDQLKNRVYKLYLALFRHLIPSARIIANSSATATALENLGFEVARIVPLAADRPPRLEHSPPSKRLLFAGRLLHQKGLSWFVSEVLPLLPSEIGLDVAGPVWDATEAAALEDPRVEYRGNLAPKELFQAYRDALSVIIPNRDLGSGHFEGFGLVAPEAAASGGVVVSADVGGLRDAVLDKETGFLLPAGDAEHWAAKLVEISNWSKVTREEFVSRSVSAAEWHFSWDRVVRDTFAVYTEGSGRQQ